MKSNFPIHKFQNLETPFYYYDTALLRKTLNVAQSEADKYGYLIHYAGKANTNPKLLRIICEAGMGMDCVSGGEVELAMKSGFSAEKVVFAGVGKTDAEINLALDCNIFCFNAESAPELEIINELAGKKGKVANVAIRVNPNVDAYTHRKITTGLSENKFGINIEMLPEVIQFTNRLNDLKISGLHFHVGSQITDLSVFENLCVRINELQDELKSKLNMTVEHINVGGGLGVNYEHPNHLSIPDFEAYFRVFNKYLKLRAGQELHCELGRSIVAQCGTLISRVIFVKEATTKKFAILDAGFTDLLRPAMYDSYHRIENLTSDEPCELYDVVGPICESSDVFGKDRELTRVHRGDLIAIRSAGAYGEVMTSQYNLRRLPQAYLSEEL